MLLKRLLLRWVFLGSVLAVAACGSHKDRVADLSQYVKKVGDAVKFEKAKPITHRKFTSVTYQASAKRSPFQEKSLTAPGGSGKHNSLNEYPLDKLQLKGVLAYSGLTYAIIRTPKGKVYQVKKGDHIGVNDGEVVQISPSVVKVVESLTDEFGASIKRVINLRLKKMWA